MPVLMSLAEAQACIQMLTLISSAYPTQVKPLLKLLTNIESEFCAFWNHVLAQAEQPTFIEPAASSRAKPKPYTPDP
jgi:hypothetical protein